MPAVTSSLLGHHAQHLAGLAHHSFSANKMSGFSATTPGSRLLCSRDCRSSTWKRATRAGPNLGIGGAGSVAWMQARAPVTLLLNPWHTSWSLSFNQQLSGALPCDSNVASPGTPGIPKGFRFMSWTLKDSLFWQLLLPGPTQTSTSLTLQLLWDPGKVFAELGPIQTQLTGAVRSTHSCPCYRQQCVTWAAEAQVQKRRHHRNIHTGALILGWMSAWLLRDAATASVSDCVCELKLPCWRLESAC